MNMDVEKKTKLFISYSRKDRALIDDLYDALESDDELDVFRDSDDILPTEEWKPRLEALIRSSDVILFALSPDSATSEICQWELELADSLNKKIIPVVVREVDGNVPETVAKLNYIFLTKKGDFKNALTRIGEAINVDIDWIREHTRIGELASRWDQSQKLGAQPLRGGELQQAEQWLAGQPKEAPAPTPLHRNYIYESRKTATKRSQITAAASFAAVLIVGVLAVFAWIQRDAAIEGERKAEAALRSATQAANTLVFDLADEFKNSSLPGSIIESILDKARILQDNLSENFPDDPDLQRSQAAALSGLGDVYIKQKSLKEAKNSYEASLNISRKLVALDPDNTDWQRDISLNLNKVGNVKLQAGDAIGALAAFEEGLNISRKLVVLDSNNTRRQRDVFSSLERIGDMRLQAGDATGALTAYGEGLNISRKLVVLDPNNTEWQRDVSVILNSIGIVKLQRGDATGALAAYEEGLDISRKLVALDPNNTLWQRDVSVNLSAISIAKLQRGGATGRLAAYEEVLDISRKLVALDPNNIEWQRDVSVIFNNIGIVKLQRGDATGALAAFEEGLDISRKLVALDPNNTEWQRDVFVSLNTIDNMKLKKDDATGVLAAYDEGLNISRESVALNPNNTQQRNSFASLNNIGDMKLQGGDAIGALAAYEEGLNIARTIVALDPNNIEWQRYVSFSLNKIGVLYYEAQDYRLAYMQYNALLKHSIDLTKRFPTVAEFVSHVEFSRDRLAVVVGTLAYYTLFDREFVESEQKSREAIELDPEPLWLKANLAHALMFQNKLDEASEIYLKYRGEKMNEGLWEEVILAEFKKLKSKGITHPHMAEIERLFKN